jgi:SprT protein
MTKQDTIRTKVLDLCDKARAKFELDLPTPRITFDLRGHCAGQYVRKLERETLRFNFDLLNRYPQEMLDQTVPHEVAHLVARHVHMGRRIRSHGREWQAIMRFFGCEPSRCHNMETTPARQTRKYAVACDCPEQHIYVGRRVRDRIAFGLRKYTCKVCKGSVRIP